MGLLNILTEKLNGKAATAFTRLVVIASPVALTVATYAAGQWLDQKIAEAPVVVLMSRSQTEVSEKLLDHTRHIQDLLQFRIQTEIALNADSNFRRELNTKLLDLTREFDRLAGAIEAQNKILDREAVSGGNRNVGPRQ